MRRTAPPLERHGSPLHADHAMFQARRQARRMKAHGSLWAGHGAKRARRRAGRRSSGSLHPHGDSDTAALDRRRAVTTPIALRSRVRYRRTDQGCTIVSIEADCAVRFDEAQRAVTGPASFSTAARNASAAPTSSIAADRLIRKIEGQPERRGPAGQLQSPYDPARGQARLRYPRTRCRARHRSHTRLPYSLRSAREPAPPRGRREHPREDVQALADGRKRAQPRNRVRRRALSCRTSRVYRRWSTGRDARCRHRSRQLSRAHQPLSPAELVIDHSVQVTSARRTCAQQSYRVQRSKGAMRSCAGDRMPSTISRSSRRTPASSIR